MQPRLRLEFSRRSVFRRGGQPVPGRSLGTRANGCLGTRTHDTYFTDVSNGAKAKFSLTFNSIQLRVTYEATILKVCERVDSTRYWPWNGTSRLIV